MLDQEYIDALVNQALSEDIGSGDITAELVGVEEILQARVVTRESGVLCGRAFADTVFAAVDASLAVTWHCADGEELAPDDLLFEVSGNARSILTAERTALNSCSYSQEQPPTADRSPHWSQTYPCDCWILEKPSRDCGSHRSTPSPAAVAITIVSACSTPFSLKKIISPLVVALNPQLVLRKPRHRVNPSR